MVKLKRVLNSIQLY